MEIDGIEERLKCFLGQIEAEKGIFERIVYKNKNQHRRCSYFDYLLQVRRDLRLLQSAKVEELVSSCFHVITERRPKQKIHLLESLKWRKCDHGTPNFIERLLGVARLLSQMAEPILKAAVEITTLLARSFFMGFSLTVLALLARLRVLVQQMLVDVVSIFNMVSSISQKKQSVKITQEGVEVFREYFPTHLEFVTLECVWKIDKFILLERPEMIDLKNQGGNPGDTSTGTLVPTYQILESFLGDDFDLEKKAGDSQEKGGIICGAEEKEDMLASPLNETAGKNQVGDDAEMGNKPAIAENFDQEQPSNDELPTSSTLSPIVKPKSSPRKVAFVSTKRPALSSTAAFVAVKRPATSNTNATYLQTEALKEDASNEEDSFFNLLAGGNMKGSLF